MDLQEIRASLLADDNKALTFIYLKYGDYCVKTLTTKHLCSKQDAEGLFIESVILLRDKILNGGITQLTNTRYYLYKTCENIFLAKLKVERNKEKKLSDVEHFFYASSYLTIDEDNGELNLSKATQYAWEQLNEKCKDIIYFFYVDKLKMEKIAELMGFASSDVAKTTKARCYKQLVKFANDFYSKLEKNDD